MKKLMILFITLILFSLALYGCTQNSTSNFNGALSSVTDEGLSEGLSSSSLSNSAYEEITPQEAKILMDTQKNYIILDVRTEEEFAEGHIAKAILIPDYEIREKAEDLLSDKNQLILVYCRSGRRSKNAAKDLVSLGYTNVKEFGGIIQWEYGTTTE